MDAAGRPAEKSYDVTVVEKAVSSDDRPTDKQLSSRDADSQEVCSMISETAGAGRNNERTFAAAAECVRAADTVLTSGASQEACSRRGEGQFTADAAPRGASSSRHAAIPAADTAASNTRSDPAGRQAIDDDGVGGGGRRAPTLYDDAGLMCRHDVIVKRHVTNDVSDVAAMADKRRKSPDPFCVDEDNDEAVAETVAVPDDSVDDELSLQRQNSVLVQLLSAKKLELDEAREMFRVCTAGLEDEVERLRQEKERLLDRLQLPEDERCSLSVEQQSLNELSRRLRQCDEQNEELKNENMELKQDLRDAELAMHELHDQFQAEEGVELRELQRELDNTARDCRLLHFKVLHSMSSGAKRGQKFLVAPNIG